MAQVQICGSQGHYESQLNGWHLVTLYCFMTLDKALFVCFVVFFYSESELVALQIAK